MPPRCPGDGLESLDAAELTFERAVVFEDAVVNHLDRAQGAELAPGEPDIAVTAATDLAEQYVVRNRRRRRTVGLGRGRRLHGSVAGRNGFRQFRVICSCTGHAHAENSTTSLDAAAQFGQALRAPPFTNTIPHR